VEILADRDVHARVAPEGWEPIGRAMERDFGNGEFEPGVIRGVRAVSELLELHYPAGRVVPEKLPDRPVAM
jgi:uncharacterized membrane protein